MEKLGAAGLRFLNPWNHVKSAERKKGFDKVVEYVKAFFKAVLCAIIIPPAGCGLLFLIGRCTKVQSKHVELEGLTKEQLGFLKLLDECALKKVNVHGKHDWSVRISVEKNLEEFESSNIQRAYRLHCDLLGNDIFVLYDADSKKIKLTLCGMFQEEIPIDFPENHELNSFVKNVYQKIMQPILKEDYFELMKSGVHLHKDYN